MAALEEAVAMTGGDGREDSLVAACREGDREAFRQLFELHQRRIWSIAFHFTGEESAARDIAQQVFLKLFSAISQFRRDANFSTWLYRLVVNACLDERRRRQRLRSLEFFRERLGRRERSTDPSPESQHAQRQMEEAVRRAVSELPPKLRLAVLLKHFENLSYEEMAQVLDCSPGTVASRLHRGHRELARKLSHLRGEL